MPIRSGIRAHNRELLETLHREAKGPFTVEEASGFLSLGTTRTTRLLAYFAARGWLTRVRRGLYTTVPLGAADPSDWCEDPWVVAAKTFQPCYIGGWSALEHWDLTEQIFRDVLVCTARQFRSRDRLIQGVRFRLRRRRAEHQFGTRGIWRGMVPVLVSDPSRTLIDVLDDPKIGGGIRHIAECIGTYFDSEYRDDGALSDYAERLGNRTVFKRLGYMLERLSVQAPALVDTCLERRSEGLSPLDPSVTSKGRILKRWNLWVNVSVGRET